MQRISLFVFIAVLLTLITAGCGGGHSSNPGPTVEYHLLTADTRALPAPIFDDTVIDDPSFHLLIVTEQGTIRLKPNGFYEHRIQSQVWIDGVRNLKNKYVDHGLYRVKGQRIEFESDLIEYRAYSGTLVNGVINLQNDIIGEGKINAFVYQK